MKIFFSKPLLQALLAIGAGAVTLEGCGKSAATDETATTTSEDKLSTLSKEGAAAVNALAAAYPGALAISVFPSAGTGLQLADPLPPPADAPPSPGALPPPDVAGSDRPPEEKQKEATDRMKGEGECFDLRQMAEFKARFSQVKCYEFDTDMNPFRMSTDTVDRFGTTNGLDGFTSSTQACLVTFTKAQVDEVIHLVDRSLSLVQGLICVEKKLATKEAREVRKPKIDGDAISLAEAINAKLPTGAPISFTKADISVVTNPAGGLTYVTQIALTNPFGKTDTITLRHTPATTESTTESGILSFVRQPLGIKTPNYNPNDVNAQADKFDVMAIKYSKTSDGTTDKMKAELTRAMINKKYEPLNAEGLVNFAAIPDTALNSDIHAIKYVAFDLVPSTGEGSLSYWMNPGGNLAESARGLVFNLTADATTGYLSGCGTSGATSDVSIRGAIADSSKALAPTRFWHPQAAQNTSPNKDTRYVGGEGAFVTKQCVTQDSAGFYLIDSTKTTSAKGYDVIKGSDSTIRTPQRPPDAKLPPPPAPPKPL